MDPRFFRRYLDILSERVVAGQTGVQVTGPEPTDDQMADAEEKQRAELGLPSKKADDEAKYQRQLKAYQAGDNRAAGPFFKPRPGDELKERVTVDPATGQSSDPRRNPGQEAYDIQKQKYNIGLTDPDAPDEDPSVGPAAQKWQKQQKSMAYDDRGIPMSVAPARDKTGVLYDKYKNPISQQGKTSGYRDTSGVDYDAAGNPARKAGVQPKKPNSYY